MLRFGVAAAVLVFAGAFLASQGRSETHRAVTHTCGLADRQFLSNYQVSLLEVGVYGDDYLRGSATAKDVTGAAHDAAKTVRAWTPLDPSLKLVHHYAPAMFLQYAEAVRARAAGKTAAREMYLAYSIGSRVDETLRDAKPGLEAAGCDVSGVLQ